MFVIFWMPVYDWFVLVYPLLNSLFVLTILKCVPYSKDVCCCFSLPDHLHRLGSVLANHLSAFRIQHWNPVAKYKFNDKHLAIFCVPLYYFIYDQTLFVVWTQYKIAKCTLRKNHGFRISIYLCDVALCPLWSYFKKRIR